MGKLRLLGQAGIVVLGAGIFAAVGTGLFVLYPDTLTELFGVVLALGLVVGGVKLAASVARSLLPEYDVAEVAVEGPITRDGGGGPFPSSPRSTPADDIVDQIDRANDEGRVEALLLKLNTPGGEVVPSDDIRLAAQRFEGPTIAYATDTCASGGYWIASGCDEFWARDASIVGSIGVIGSRVNATSLAEKLGLSYERFTGGAYKDAGIPLKEMEDDEREYLQGIVDDFYDHFVERVSDGRDLDPATIRDTEARIYLGGAAHDLGLVDELGTRRDIEDVLADRLDRKSVTIEEFEPPRSFMQLVGSGAQRIALAFGAGLTRASKGEFRLRT